MAYRGLPAAERRLLQWQLTLVGVVVVVVGGVVVVGVGGGGGVVVAGLNATRVMTQAVPLWVPVAVWVPAGCAPASPVTLSHMSERVV